MLRYFLHEFIINILTPQQSTSCIYIRKYGWEFILLCMVHTEVRRIMRINLNNKYTET